ncbi:MAG: hypothetical protein OIF57_19805 [Marinobacterium sp.]|nr:hypothetical protein [Marinobacterium sp.]
MSIKIIAGQAVAMSEDEIAEQQARRAAAQRTPSVAVLIGQVKAAAEQQRLYYITAGHGKAAEYAGLLLELSRYDADPAPTPENYPYLSAGAGEATGRSFAEEVKLVRTTAQRWVPINAVIRRLEIEAVEAIRAAAKAGDIEAMQTAAEVDWSVVDRKAAEVQIR